MLQGLCCRSASIVAALVGCLVSVAPAAAQNDGPCCLPDGTWLSTSPWNCHVLGGIFKVSGETQPTPCGSLEPGVSMSQAAVRRLVRQGVVHTIWSDAQPIDLYTSEDPAITGMWSLLATGAVIAPQFHVDLRDYDASSIGANAEEAAADVIDRVQAAEVAWHTAHPALPFHWALRLQNLGQSHRHEQGAASMLATFSNHEADLPTTTGVARVAQKDYIAHRGHVGQVSGDSFHVIEEERAFFGQFTNAYYTSGPASVTIDGAPAGVVTAFNPSTGVFTLSGAVPPGAAAFAISRGDPAHPQRGLLPCYFFRNGAIEVGEWATTFCEFISSNAPGLPHPVAVVVGTEDIGEVSIDWSNYVEYLNDPKAGNNNFKIDASHTLAQWHSEFAGDLDFDPLPTGGYSPANGNYHSYLSSTFITAYNYHREVSTWRHFRGLWPRAGLTQYILGKGYGVTHDDDPYEVPTGPGTASHHGRRNWKGSVSWDAYYCITNPDHGWRPGEDGGVRPMTYDAASVMKGTAASATGSLLVGVLSDPFFDPENYLIENHRLFVQFTSGANSLDRRIIEVTAWDGGTNTFTLASAFEYAVAPGDAFVLYYPSLQYFESAANTAIWPTMETYCDRYGQAVDRWGFEATMKKWAAEQTLRQTRALPDNPYAVYYSPGSVVGYGHAGGIKVSFQTTYPNAPFTAQDGWLGGSDWAEIGIQAMNYGVSHFVWYRPNIMGGGAANANFLPIIDAIAAMHQAYITTLLPVYMGMECIADWNQDGVIDQLDADKFGSDWLSGKIETDLNRNGLVGIPDGDGAGSDMDLFESAHRYGICGSIPVMHDCDRDGIPDATEIANGAPDLNLDGIPDSCQTACDADWCHDGSVGVPDIFCFLSDWFANDSTARNYGGTPGVPAIFAFLATWFATGQGPCVP